MEMKRVNFTLIELLVVVSIIAILAGMLMPALSQAREKAVAVNCSSRLKQIGTADAFYQADWGYFSPSRESMSGAVPGPSWHGYQNGTGLSNPQIDLTSEQGYLSAYLKKAGVGKKVQEERASNIFICPHSSVDKMLGDDEVTSARGTGYGPNKYLHGMYFMVNANMAASATYLPKKDTKVKQPSSIASFGDAAQNLSGTLAVYDTLSCNGVHFRHSSRANITWADGHVSAETGYYNCTGSSYNSSGPVPGMNLGCLNASKDICNTGTAANPDPALKAQNRYGCTADMK